MTLNGQIAHCYNKVDFFSENYDDVSGKLQIRFVDFNHPTPV